MFIINNFLVTPKMSDLYIYYKNFLVDSRKMPFSTTQYITMIFWQMEVMYLLRKRSFSTSHQNGLEMTLSVCKGIKEKIAEHK